MIKSQFKKNEGFSLIEVLTALVVISMVLSLLLSGLIYVNTIDKKMAFMLRITVSIFRISKVRSITIINNTVTDF